MLIVMWKTNDVSDQFADVWIPLFCDICDPYSSEIRIHSLHICLGACKCLYTSLFLSGSQFSFFLSEYNIKLATCLPNVWMTTIFLDYVHWVVIAYNILACLESQLVFFTFIRSTHCSRLITCTLSGCWRVLKYDYLQV